MVDIKQRHDDLDRSIRESPAGKFVQSLLDFSAPKQESQPQQQPQVQSNQSQQQQKQMSNGFDEGFRLVTSIGRGAAQGEMAGSSLPKRTEKDMIGFLRQQGIVLSPQQELAIQQKLVEDAAGQQNQLYQENLGLGAGLGNQAANANTQRQMALNAQNFAAQNVANQLSNLSDRARTTQATLAAAGNTAASLFR